LHEVSFGNLREPGVMVTSSSRSAVRFQVVREYLVHFGHRPLWPCSRWRDTDCWPEEQTRTTGERKPPGKRPTLGNPLEVCIAARYASFSAVAGLGWKCRKRRTPLLSGSGVHGCGGWIWTTDLWVMRSDSPFGESRTVPSPARGARHPVSTPSPSFRGLVRYCPIARAR